MVVFKVMTWNVENLFQVGEPSGPTTPAAYDHKLTGLAKAINDQAPDALALQEIGNPAALDDLVTLLEGQWQRQVSTHPDARHIRVAWLTPRHIHDPTEILAFPTHVLPVQVDDQDATVTQMGRGAVAITIQGDSGQTSASSRPISSPSCSPSPAAGSFPTTKTNGPGSPPTPCTDARPRRQPYGWPCPRR
jgi:hypothetical protein